MPLILLTGFPSSGKTRLAKKLLEEFQKRLDERKIKKHVRIVSDTDQLEWDGRNVIYNSIAKEKELRGWIRSEAQRYVNLDNIVILDVAAYIKGFRYELYCMTKEAKTQYCVVECLPSVDMCRTWNKQLVSDSKKNPVEDDSPELGYNDATFDGLMMRYEKCDETNRWDSPLFRLDPVQETLDYDKIFDLVTIGEPLIPNKSTSLTQTTSTIYSKNKDQMEPDRRDT